MQIEVRNFKVKVSENHKSGLRLPVRGGTFSCGQSIALTAEEFFLPTVQMAIQKGLLLIEEKPKDEDIAGKLFRSVYIRPMGIPSLGGLTVKFNQVFFVSNDKMDDPIIDGIIKKKWIVPESEFLASQKPLSEEEEKEKIAVSPAPAIQQAKTVKVAKATKTAKAGKKTVKSSEPEKIKGIENVPANMHVHVPEAVRGEVEIRKAPKSDGIIDLSVETEEQGLDFVDQTSNNNEEVE